VGDRINDWNPFFIHTLLCCSAGSNLTRSFLLFPLGFLGHLLSLLFQSCGGWWTGDRLGEPSLGQWGCPAEPRWCCAGREGDQAKPGLLSLGIFHLPASSLYFSFYGPRTKKYCDQDSLAIWQSGREHVVGSIFISDQKSTLSWAQAAVQMHTGHASVVSERAYARGKVWASPPQLKGMFSSPVIRRFSLHCMQQLLAPNYRQGVIWGSPAHFLIPKITLKRAFITSKSMRLCHKCISE